MPVLILDNCWKPTVNRLPLITLLLFLGFNVPTVFAQNNGQDNGQDSGFNTPAEYALIMDYDTGEILYEKKARVPTAPASMTKIMTANLVFEALKDGSLTEGQIFTVSQEAVRRGGYASGSSNMVLDPRSKVPVIDLLRGVIVQSGNDACITLAEGMSGDEASFAKRMTMRAKELGLDSATFKNSTGWPDAGHEISALDLARLTQHTIREHPEYYKLYAEKSFFWNGYNQKNRNPLLENFTGADGVKTGHTEISGYGLVGSAVRGGERRIIVINGLDSNPQRLRESVRVMTAAFNQFKAYKLYSAGDTVGEIDVYMGKAEKVSGIVKDDILAGLYIGDRDDLAVKMTYKPAIAPVEEGQHIADLHVTAPGMTDKVIPVFAAGSVKEKSILGKAMAGLGMVF